MVGALVAHDRDAGRLGGLDVGRRRPLVDGADDRHGGARALGGDGVERLDGVVALPVLGHLEHPVEADGAVEAPGARRLVREHPAHAEPGDADGLHLEQVGGRHQVGQQRPVVDRGDGAQPLLERHVLPPRPRLHRRDRPAVVVREPLRVLVEQRPQPHDVRDQHQAPRSAPTRRRASDSTGVPDGSVVRITSTGRGCWTRRGG